MMASGPMSPPCRMWLTPVKSSGTLGSRKPCVSEMTPIFIGVTGGGRRVTRTDAGRTMAVILPLATRHSSPVSRLRLLRLGFGFRLAHPGRFFRGRFGGGFHRADEEAGEQPAAEQRVAEKFPGG